MCFEQQANYAGTPDTLTIDAHYIQESSDQELSCRSFHIPVRFLRKFSSAPFR